MLCLYNRFKRLKIVPFCSVHSFSLLLPITLPEEFKKTKFILSTERNMDHFLCTLLQHLNNFS